ncbi:DUF2125 domain-containing protein [Bradyrhizobium sp. C9]|uniref:DUF2125 domain-containing protein n=1 Tax=Bradyrhizobium sp. C9 TaxID=142585 RepID=UPI0018EA2EF4|nr:DUF2125 domain-containing protein [Bradyrhizobium sp. C9]
MVCANSKARPIKLTGTSTTEYTRQNLGHRRGAYAKKRDRARSFPLRFADGAVFLGPLKVAQIPPLF